MTNNVKSQFFGKKEQENKGWLIRKKEREHRYAELDAKRQMIRTKSECFVGAYKYI